MRRARWCWGATLWGLLWAASANAADVRGELQGVDGLQPSPPIEANVRNAYYWEEPNGAIETRRPHAVPEVDLAVVLAGQGLPEGAAPVNLPVVGGRCRPGTVVMAPNGVLRVQNQDWFPRNFYLRTAASAAPIANWGPEVTAPRSERQAGIAQAGLYELRDRTQPNFRCWVLVGEGQGRVGAVTGNEFRFPNVPDGQYTVRVYYEGRRLAEGNVRVQGRDERVSPALCVNPAGCGNRTQLQTQERVRLALRALPTRRNTGRRTLRLALRSGETR